VYERQKHPFLSPPATLHQEEPLYALMQDTLRSSSAANVPFLDQRKVVAALDALNNQNADFGRQIVTDQVLTLALSFVFMHEGLGITS
jgi:asparagine synthase (glutamine-hydrolysing)